MALKDSTMKPEASWTRLSALNGDFLIRAGQANPAVLDRIYVDYYGTATPINQLAAISVSKLVFSYSTLDKSSLTNIEKLSSNPI